MSEAKPVHVTEDDLEAVDPSTICDRCGDDIPLVDTSAGRESWATGAGATLCPDCWAEAEAEEGDQAIDWQQFTVTGGLLSRNAAGQFTGSLQLARDGDGPGDWLTLNFVFDRTGAKWGWRPDEPEFAPDFQEE